MAFIRAVPADGCESSKQPLLLRPFECWPLPARRWRTKCCHKSFIELVAHFLRTPDLHSRTQLAMTSMFVPEPVMSLAITPKKTKKGGGSDTADKFSKVRSWPLFHFVANPVWPLAVDSLLAAPNTPITCQAPQ